MKLPNWISEYSPLSCSDGEIESIVVILPPERFKKRNLLYKPLLQTLNSTRRSIIKFYNDPSQLSDFDEEHDSSEDVVNEEHLETSSQEEGENWENQTRSFIKPAQESNSNEQLEAWEDATRYFIDLGPSFSPYAVVGPWRENHGDSKVAKPRIHYRRWVQDLMFCLQKFSGSALETTMLYSIFQQRMVDFMLTLELSQNPSLNLRSHPTKLVIEGGNILYIDKILFIGKELVEKNIGLLNSLKKKKDGDSNAWDEKRVLEFFEIQFNVHKAVSLGSKERMPSFAIEALSEKGELKYRQSFQPFFHLDLYLNFGGIDPESGKRVAFVGSPRLAMELLNPQPKTENERAISNNPGEVLRHPHQGKKTIGSTHSIDDLIELNEPFFTELKESLVETGLKVVEIPLYLWAEPIAASYAVCSWNNALVEVYNQGRNKHIYIPSYYVKDRKDLTGHNKRIKILEAEVKKIYEAHGFSVHLIDAGRLFRNACQRGGSLHCMVKVLRRKYS